jgi:hypothetical protein
MKKMIYMCVKYATTKMALYRPSFDNIFNVYDISHDHNMHFSEK